MSWKTICWEAILLGFLFSCTGSDKDPMDRKYQIDYDYLKSNFQQPDRTYGVNCWWWWLNGNVTKEAITKDLEAMKSRNFQGAMIFDAGGHNQRGNKDIPAGPLFGSEEWTELFVFALDEAKRLGLEIGFNIQSGWNLGGPCVTPQYAAKQLTYSERKVTGGKTLRLQLAEPDIYKGFYKDIVVLAFPSNKENKTNEPVSNLDLKLGFHELGGSAPDCRFLLENNTRGREKKTDKTIYLIDIARIVDLTTQMDEKGLLSWDAPEGDWNIMRIGYTCTRSEVSTSSRDWQGNVLDYMDRNAFDYYWNTIVEPILQAAGEKHVGSTLKFMETDSWECGGMNWTDAFADEFRSYCGYDLKLYLPLIAGHVVDNIDTSNAFLADFRKTIAHLVATNHYACFAEHAHQHNMGIQPESAGPHAGPLDGMKNYGFSDIVMSEFWSPSPHRPRPQDRFFIKQASSAAHIYGKKIVGAESFTTIGPHWNDELWHDQKSAFDHEICAGLNRVYFHTFTCSPAEQGIPGQEYFAGTHVNPRVTWWSKSAPFIDYMHRVQMLAQEGTFVADILYYYGDHVPNVYPFKHSDMPGAMFGFDYDVTDENILMKLGVKDGDIVVPGGRKYKVLVLPDHRILSLPVLKKLEMLVKEGASVLGPKPQKAVSLFGGEKGAAEFKKLVDLLWGTTIGTTGQNQYGKGFASWGITAKEYLLSRNQPVDFAVEGNDSKTDFDYIHYVIDDAHVYFVSNQTTERQKIDACFRVSGLQPELWNALTGEIREAGAFTQKDEKTVVPLTLEPYGSMFVVFHKKIDRNKQGAKAGNDPDYEILQTLDGAWTVNFDPEWGGPSSVVFPELIDWTRHSDKRIKYFSGTAVYNKKFTVNFEKNPANRYYLQLENVKDVGIASVCINGKDKGIVWTKPFRVDITDGLKEGENDVVVEVTNSWFNRVAGDEMAVSPTKYTQTNIVLGNDFRGNAVSEITLEPSGLLGPVTIQVAVEQK